MPNLHMLIKQKTPSLPRKLALGTFGKFPVVFSTKVNLLCLLYSTDSPEVLSSPSDKAKLFMQKRAVCSSNHSANV